MFYELIGSLSAEQKKELVARGVPQPRLSEWNCRKRLPTRAQVLILADVAKVDPLKIEAEVMLLEAPPAERARYAERLGVGTVLAVLAVLTRPDGLLWGILAGIALLTALRPWNRRLAVAGLAFLAVGREGFETALFMVGYAEAAASAPAAAPETAKGGNRIKEMLEKRKRPLLLGLAALVLALGTAHLVSGALKGPRTAATGEAVQSPIAPREEAPALPPPAKDQSSALQPGTAAPQASTLAAIPAGAPPAAEVTGSTTQPPAPPLAAPVAAPPAANAEAVQPVTGLGELPPGLGGPGLRKAALDGDARAVYELASRAADGPAATRDPKLAMRLFERAAVAGLAPAQFRLGNMFEKGIGTARDLSLARVWYTRAAERGNAKAMHNLAVLHAEGVSGKPDYASATDWFRRAAEHGVRDSQYNLAVLLGRGLGAPTDLAQSYLWFAVAASQGDDDATRKRDEVAQRLSPTDLAAAKAEAAAWKPRQASAAANEVTPPARGWEAAPTATAPKPAKPARI